MSDLTHVWLYGGATSEDVYAALDDKPSDYIDLETMASPQCWRVATEYSETMVRDIAAEMFEQLVEYYWEGDEPSLFPPSLDNLQKVVASKVCEPLEGQTEPLEVVEVTTITYYEQTDVEQKEPLMFIVVQERPVWQRINLADTFRRDDTDRA